MTPQRNIVFVGGPESGKSNYLFRSWLAIERETGMLVKNGLPSDVDYLHEGATSLLDGKFAPHTSRDTRKICDIPIHGRSAPRSESTLVVPDASGEVWLDVFQKREWPASWDELISRDSGFLVFVRAAAPNNIPALDWIACEKAYGRTERRVAPTPGLPTQVLLVDWVQILRSIVDRRVGRSFVPRLSVVITAWDSIPGDRQQSSPQDYLEAEFPLFGQFIRAGCHGFDSNVFGVSVLGGDPDRDGEFRSELLTRGPAIAGYSVASQHRGAERIDDVLSPIYWALGMDQ